MNKIQKTIEYYDKFAEKYDSARYQTKQQKIKDNVSKEIFLRFAKKLDGKDHLDVGCGTGRIIKLFHKKKFNVHGVDTSKNMLNITLKKVPEAILKQGNVMQIPSFGKKFDLITCSQVLTHVGNYDRPIENFSKLLKDNGIIIIDIRNKLNPINIIMSVLQRFSRNNYQPTYVTLKHIRKLAKKHGLRVSEFQGHNIKETTSPFAKTITIKLEK